MATCASCGAELEPGAKFCVMCGTKVDASLASTAPYATSTLTGSGLIVAIATAATCATIAVGAFVLLDGVL